MHYLNAILTTLGDLALSGFRWENPWPAMIAASLLATIVLLLVMRAVARPEAITRSKKRLTARVMELHLFRHDPLVSLAACRRIFVANFVYFRHLFRPLCWAMLPGLLILIQLDGWFAKRPLRVGETAILEVEMDPQISIVDQEFAITTSSSLSLDSPALRIPSLRQVNWKLRAEELQEGWVSLDCNGAAVRKQVSIGDRLARISERRVRAGFWEQLFNPGEPPIDAACPIESIRVRYPPRKMYVGLREVHWLVAFLVLTIIFGVVLKGPLKAPL